MKTYTFTLVLSGFSELREDMEDRLFESGCDDALLSFRDGVPYLDFDREAETLREAILSAIINVEGAGIGACVREHSSSGCRETRSRWFSSAFTRYEESNSTLALGGSCLMACPTRM